MVQRAQVVDGDPVPDGLTDESVVIEAGCYEGAWAAKVSGRLHCTVHAFEPATRAYGVACKRLAGMEGVSVWPMALGRACGTMKLYCCRTDGASSHPSLGEPSEMVQVVDASLVVGLLGKVDLMHLNAEGGEIDILERLIETGQIVNVRMVMAQWHRRGDTGDHIARVENALAKTHDKQSWVYWGYWELKQKSTVE